MTCTSIRCRNNRRLNPQSYLLKNPEKPSNCVGPLLRASSASHPSGVDYLRYRCDFPLAVMKANAAYRQAADGMQQAKQYAEMLGLKFAYATNGLDIIEFDYCTGLEKTRTD